MSSIHTWAGTLGAVGFIALGSLTYYVTSEDNAVKAELLAKITATQVHEHEQVDTKDIYTRLGLIEMNQTKVMNWRVSARAEMTQVSNNNAETLASLEALAHKLESVDRLLFEVNSKMIDRDVMTEIVAEVSAELLELRMRIEELESANEQSKRRELSGATRSGSESVSSTGDTQVD